LFETDDESLETKLTITYGRDRFGNVTSVTADDAYGDHRSSSVTYDAEGIFPTSSTNAAKHTSLTEFDPVLGVLTKVTDPNGLVTEWKHDGFRRLGLEIRPDGSETSITLSRSKDGGPKQNAWRVLQRSVTTGGADDTVEYDSKGRPIRWWWHGPAPARPTGEPPRLMQEVVYNPLNGQIAQRSVPVSEDTPESQMLFDVIDYDAASREVRHTSPWNAVTETSYDGLFVHVTDPLLNVTSTKLDALSRPENVTDAAKQLTSYTYGPFGYLYTVTAPGNALTRITRNAFGGVRKLEDPDRGTTLQEHNGYGELRSSVDASGRKVTLKHDKTGRVKWRIDQIGAETLMTHWTWDTAPNGIGKLHTLESPDGLKTYTYTKRGQLESLTLAINGEVEPLQARLGYDTVGRVKEIAYPAPSGASPFSVTQDRDPYGNVLMVRKSATNLAYWHLTDVDDAGRFRTEEFDNGFTTERSYYPDKQQLKSIVTELVTPSETKTAQDLSYEYDIRLNLSSRTDTLQPQYKTERFRYDPIERLTCADFSATEDPFAPCDRSYGHAPNGNLTFKSDVGVLSYTEEAWR
jgi:YD repeat-containing protein